MRIRLPIMIQDPKLSGYPQLKRIVERPYVHEDSFADGPACPRVAVVDLDPATGAARPGVPFEPPRTGRKLWRYAIADENDIYAPDFMAVNASALCRPMTRANGQRSPRANRWIETCFCNAW